ncbi:MAG: NUDIX hydrolase [Erysipelotrichaceae bacterium]
MNLKQALLNFESIDRFENQDKQVMLHYLDVFDDLYERRNEIAHITSSAWILNKTGDKVLMIYHNIYDSWGWVGGHADGDHDLAYVALKEAKEETGLTSLTQVGDGFIAVDILPVWHHLKRGEVINSHLHMNVTYLFIGDEQQSIRIKPDENSGVKWIDVKAIDEFVSEASMLPIYHKLMGKSLSILGGLQ